MTISTSGKRKAAGLSRNKKAIKFPDGGTAIKWKSQKTERVEI